MAYNMSFTTNTTGFPELFNGFNNALSGIPAMVIVFVIYLGLFAAFKNFDTVHDVIISSFITVIIASLFWFLGLVDWWVIVVPFTVMVAGIIINFFR